MNMTRIGAGTLLSYTRAFYGANRFNVWVGLHFTHLETGPNKCDLIRQMNHADIYMVPEHPPSRKQGGSTWNINR